MHALKIGMALGLLLISLVSGILPFYRKIKFNHVDFPMGAALTSGVFLGAGLIHMLADANEEFVALGSHYPWAFLIAGSSFLLFLMLEHWVVEMQHHVTHSTLKHMAILATVMLSIHSLLEGAAVGLTRDVFTSIILLVAIAAHKWAESFALALQLNKSGLNSVLALGLFLLFALMSPLGILWGDCLNQVMSGWALLTPVFTALAAGTFLYIGTLHGLQRATMIESCCNLKEFCFVVLGFVLMAVVAFWV